MSRTNAMSKLVVGGYELLGKLTRTKRSEIYIARRAGAAFDKIVVLKLVPLTDARVQGRTFGRVARLLARFDHPHVAPLLDFGRCEEGMYLVLEHIDGETLAVLAARCREEPKRLPPAAIAHLGAAVARALDYCRDQAAEARSLGWLRWQPSLDHVLVGYDGTVKLIGFVPTDAPPEPGQDSRHVAAILGELLATAREDDPARSTGLRELCAGCASHADVEPPSTVELARRLEGLARSPGDRDGAPSIFDENELRVFMARAFASERARRRQLVDVALSTHGAAGGSFLDRMAGRAPIRRPNGRPVESPAETRVLPTKLTLGVIIAISIIALVAPRRHPRDDSVRPEAAASQPQPVAPALAPDRRIIVIESPEPEPEPPECECPARPSTSRSRPKPAGTPPPAAREETAPTRPPPPVVTPPPFPAYTGSRGGGGIP